MTETVITNVTDGRVFRTKILSEKHGVTNFLKN